MRFGHAQGSAPRALRGRAGERGAQVDLLFDRADGIVTLCELKYTDGPFVVSKAVARELADKVCTFEDHGRTRKRVELALVTSHGTKPSIWAEELVAREVPATRVFGGL